MKTLTLGLSIFTAVATSTGVVLFKTKTPQLTYKEQVLRGPAGVGQRYNPRMNAKISGQFQVEIRSLSSPVSDAGDTISLEATITAMRAIDAAYFEWNLPEGILAQSVSSGDLGPMQAGESKTVILEALSQTKENKHVHLHVFKRINGEALGEVTQYNTRDQEKIEERLRTKAEILAAKQESLGDARQKVMQ